MIINNKINKEKKVKTGNYKSCNKCGYGFSDSSTVLYDDHLVVPSKKDPSITDCEEKAKDKHKRDALFGSILSEVNKTLTR